MGNQIHIEVRGKIATLKELDFQMVGGNSDYEVVFDFDEAWADHNVKTALFVFGRESVPKVFEGDVCGGVAINNATTCYIGVFSGDIMTTTPATITDIRQSITDIGGTPQDPTPSVYNEIIKIVGGTYDLVGDISSALDELHGYAQSLVSGGATE